MPSPDNCDPIDFSTVPTTSEDVEMLRTVRKLDRLGPAEYLEFLLAFSDRHPPGRDIPPKHEPFIL
jgi:hypothetical protein